jgi:hypothetical protein
MKRVTCKLEWADRSVLLIRIEIHKNRTPPHNARRKSQTSKDSPPDIAESIQQRKQSNGKDSKAVAELKRLYLRRPLE